MIVKCKQNWGLEEKRMRRKLAYSIGRSKGQGKYDLDGEKASVLNTSVAIYL
jgi:hypothetical protein